MTESLIPADVVEDMRRPTSVRRYRARAYAWCPRCTGGGKRTGLMPQGEHLVWREHTYEDWSGKSRVCFASGIRLCDLPPYLPGKECPCRASTPATPARA